MEGTNSDLRVQADADSGLVSIHVILLRLLTISESLSKSLFPPHSSRRIPHILAVLSSPSLSRFPVPSHSQSLIFPTSLVFSRLKNIQPNKIVSLLRLCRPSYLADYVASYLADYVASYLADYVASFLADYVASFLADYVFRFLWQVRLCRLRIRLALAI